MEHVTAVCTVTPGIRFCLRSAVIVPDMGAFHVFLVPDEGFAIVRLHLTVASVKELGIARRMKASLNATDLEIAGRIDQVEVHQRDGAAPRCIARIALAHHGMFH